MQPSPPRHQPAKTYTHWDFRGWNVHQFWDIHEISQILLIPYLLGYTDLEYHIPQSPFFEPSQFDCFVFFLIKTRNPRMCTDQLQAVMRTKKATWNMDSLCLTFPEKGRKTWKQNETKISKMFEKMLFFKGSPFQWIMFRFTNDFQFCRWPLQATLLTVELSRMMKQWNLFEFDKG